jgi:hypothetical protein
MKNGRIIVLGNYKPSGHSCGKVHDVDGISSTVMENHGAVIAILEEIYEEQEIKTASY